MQQIVGGNIRARRMALGLSQLQLSRTMFKRIDRGPYISLVESGQVNLKLSTLCDFAESLHCQPHELLLAESENAKEDTNAD